MTLTADLDAALYAELIPRRITPPPSLHTGPTEQFRLLELELGRRKLLGLAPKPEAA